jgi:hypothetical protein
MNPAQQIARMIPRETTHGDYDSNSRATPKLSKVSKLDGILSWSLVARDTCPGSKADNGELVDACAGCYAVGGNYRFSNVREPREHNREDWQHASWVPTMVALLNNSRYFRWLDSGDLYSLALAHKVLLVMTLSPWVQHWLPTRMHKFAKFASVFDAMRALPNVSVRFSSDATDGTFIAGVHGSTILEPLNPDDKRSPAKFVPTGVTECHAPQNDGKCNGCRTCFDKNVKVIGYVAHGKSMKAKIKKRANLIATDAA